jgi:hypothetical protein
MISRTKPATAAVENRSRLEASKRIEMRAVVTPSVNTMFVTGHSWLMKYIQTAMKIPQESAQARKTRLRSRPLAVASAAAATPGLLGSNRSVVIFLFWSPAWLGRQTCYQE